MTSPAALAAVPTVAPVSAVTASADAAISATAAVSTAATVPYTTFDSLRLGRTAQLDGVGKLLSLASSVFGSKNVKKPRELIGVDLVMSRKLKIAPKPKFQPLRTALRWCCG
ncbi:Uncharacterized protein Rs2_37275 [Raphanus sativus]|nr:Uncharacterized protein Rs2_37275 [Raphanus sativus]